MVSTQTGQVGKSQPRGSGLVAAVGRTSAIAGIVTSLRSEPELASRQKYNLNCLTMSQHKYVGLTLFGGFLFFAMQRMLA
jgi:hypothetical protein